MDTQEMDPPQFMETAKAVTCGPPRWAPWLAMEGGRLCGCFYEMRVRGCPYKSPLILGSISGPT